MARGDRTQIAMQALDFATVFKLRTPLLSKGRLDTVLSQTDTMRVWIPNAD